jgi:cell division protease FtsH
MCAALGGRAAEEIIFGKISTGALSDLEKVTKQAYAMVSVYGLNKRIGNRSYYDSRGENNFTKPYSEETARIIDEEVSKIIEKAYKRAKDILIENKDKLKTLANKLLETEVIFKDDLVQILGNRPHDRSESPSETMLSNDEKESTEHTEHAEQTNTEKSVDSESGKDHGSDEVENNEVKNEDPSSEKDETAASEESKGKE